MAYGLQLVSLLLNPPKQHLPNGFQRQGGCPNHQSLPALQSTVCGFLVR
jgi:hypothetical protein